GPALRRCERAADGRARGRSALSANTPSSSLRASRPPPTGAVNKRKMHMSRTIRLQSDSNAHDRPWRVAVEQGFFKAEGLDVEYQEDNPKGIGGRGENFSERWKETQLQQGALEVYPGCEWGGIERVQQLRKG